ncbi:cytidine deaminase-like protein [Fusarium oxysporum Fo47]|nr:cytidine deaminase-like protein [Fusarium oxysporum Fo47]QKD59122.1 cytidine deaminase-like protein [Fusarium oxysporum Fo47]
MLSIKGISEYAEAIYDPTPYAQDAVAMAQQAFNQPTYGVGGVLLDNDTGAILYQMHNNVITENAINDPTAHGERQIIYWYLKHAAALPEPSKLTVVTTLDPCVMCTGAFLATGINVVTMSYDANAGINWNQKWNFQGLPANLREQAQQQFSYFAVPELQLNWQGPKRSVFYEKAISGQLSQAAAAAFADSLPKIGPIFASEDPTPLNIRTLGPDSPQKRLLSQKWPLAAIYTTNISKVSGRAKLWALMSAIGLGNSAALIDPFDNLLMVMSGGPFIINTPLFNLIQAYTDVRRATQSPGGASATDGHVPHPKRCKIVLFKGPGTQATDIMDLGIYGSSLNSPNQSGGGLFYFKATQSPESLASMIQELPPLYPTELEITAQQLPPITRPDVTAKTDDNMFIQSRL